MSIHISGQYGFHFFIGDEMGEEGEMGRIGNGLEFRYVLGSPSKKINTSIGVAYERFGFSRSFKWTDATPELEERYGKFPISYKMWDDYHYISFPFYLNIDIDDGWTMSASASLDYPLGGGYFRERSSADNLVVDSNLDRFNAGKAYLFNASIGSSFLIGKAIKMSEKLDLVVEFQFKAYTLVAARSNDYFPHRESIRPYTLGLNAGIRF